MNKSHVKGTFKQIKGRIKEEAGHLTGNTATAVKGVIEQIKGTLEKGFGDVKDVVKKDIDNILDPKKAGKNS